VTSDYRSQDFILTRNKG